MSDPTPVSRPRPEAVSRRGAGPIPPAHYRRSPFRSSGPERDVIDESARSSEMSPAAARPEGPRVAAVDRALSNPLVRLQPVVHRVVGAALLLTLLGGFVFLGGCSTGPSASAGVSDTTTSTCPPPRLTPVGPTSSTSSLPPSHDNDVGRMRLPDVHPDADVDASQAPPHGRCRKP